MHAFDDVFDDAFDDFDACGRGEVQRAAKKLVVFINMVCGLPTRLSWTWGQAMAAGIAPTRERVTLEFQHYDNLPEAAIFIQTLGARWGIILHAGRGVAKPDHATKV
jgi:hypothetical protein